MALAIDGSTPAKVTGTAAGITSAAFSPPANATIVALVARNVGTVGGSADGTVTSTGGLTWALAGRKSINAGSIGGAGTDGCTEIWIAQTTTAPGSIAVTDTRASGGGANGHILKVEVFTGAEATWAGAIAAAFSTSGLPSVALTTTRANSWIFAVSSDWSAAGLGTVGSGQTMIDEDHTASQYSAHIWRQTATTPTSGMSVTSNLTAPSGQQYNILAVEIREPAGGGGRTVTVGQAVETGTVTAVTRRKARTVVQTTEADSATPVGRSKVRAVAQATEADTGQPVGRLKRRTVSGPTETGLAQPTTRIKTRAIGQPTEVDAAQPIGRRKVRLLGQAVETDLAQPVGSAGNRIVAVGQVTEVDTVAAMGRAKTRTVGQPVELDSASAFARLKVRTVAGVAEVGAANPVTPAKARILGLAVETDTATPLTRSKVRAIGQAVETDTATALLGAGPRVVARGTPTLTSATATVGLAATGSTARLVPRSEVRLR